MSNPHKLDRRPGLRQTGTWLALLLILSFAAACNLGSSSTSAQITATPQGGTEVALGNAPTVTINSPADNSQPLVNSELDVYVHAIDQVGVTRVELDADNLLVDTSASPDPNGSPTFDTLLAWTPTTSGPHVLQVIGYRGSVAGTPATLHITVVDNSNQVTQPAVSPQFLTSSPTSNPSCQLRANVNNLNVRSGPDLSFDVLSTLPLAQQVPVTGTNNDQSWWQVDVNGTIGWVSAAYSSLTGVCSNVLVVPVPATPIPLPNVTQVFNPPTFTLIPAQPPTQAPPTIRVIILPTLTNTPGPAPTQAPPTPAPTQAPPTQPNVTAVPPTNTQSPLLPDLVVGGIVANGLDAGGNVVWVPAAGVATVPVQVTVGNIGQAPANIFRIAVRQPNGTLAFATTSAPLQPGTQVTITVTLYITQPGSVPLVAIADFDNVIQESNKVNNTAQYTLNVVPATPAPGAPTVTQTFTYTPPPPTLTFTPIPPTLTPIPTNVQLPSLAVTGAQVKPDPVFISPGQASATASISVLITNVGNGPAAPFTVSITLPDGHVFTGATTQALPPGGQTQVPVNVTFTQGGQIQIEVLADSQHVLQQGSTAQNSYARGVLVKGGTSNAPTATLPPTVTPQQTLSLPLLTIVGIQIGPDASAMSSHSLNVPGFPFNVPVSVIIGNTGTAPAAPFNVSLAISNGTTVNGKSSGPLAPNGQTTVTLNMPITAPGLLSFTILVNADNGVPVIGPNPSQTIQLLIVGPGNIPTLTPTITPSPAPIQPTATATNIPPPATSTPVTASVPLLTVQDLTLPQPLVINPANPVAPLTITLKNSGSTPSQPFSITVTLSNGKPIQVPIAQAIAPNSQAQITVNIPLSQPGPLHVTVVANQNGVNANQPGVSLAKDFTVTAPQATPVPPTATNVPPTPTGVPPTVTGVPPTVTKLPATATKVPPTVTGVPPTATASPTATHTPTTSPQANVIVQDFTLPQPTVFDPANQSKPLTITLGNTGSAQSQPLTLTVVVGNNPPLQIPVPKPVAPNGTEPITVNVPVAQPGTLHIVVTVNEPNVNPAQPGKSLAKDFPIAPPPPTGVPLTATPVPPTATAVPPTTAPQPNAVVQDFTLPQPTVFDPANAAKPLTITLKNSGNAPTQPFAITVTVGNNPPIQVPVGAPIAPSAQSQIVVNVPIAQPGTLHIVVAINEPNVNPAQPGKSLAKDFPIASPPPTAVPPTPTVATQPNAVVQDFTLPQPTVFDPANPANPAKPLTITLKNIGNAPTQPFAITVTVGNNPPIQVPVGAPIAPNAQSQIAVNVPISQPGTLHIVVAINEPNVNPAQPGKSLAKDFPIAAPPPTAVPPTPTVATQPNAVVQDFTLPQPIVFDAANPAKPLTITLKNIGNAPTQPFAITVTVGNNPAIQVPVGTPIAPNAQSQIAVNVPIAQPGTLHIVVAVNEPNVNPAQPGKSLAKDFPIAPPPPTAVPPTPTVATQPNAVVQDFTLPQPTVFDAANPAKPLTITLKNIGNAPTQPFAITVTVGNNPAIQVPVGAPIAPNAQAQIAVNVPIAQPGTLHIVVAVNEPNVNPAQPGKSLAKDFPIAPPPPTAVPPTPTVAAQPDAVVQDFTLPQPIVFDPANPAKPLTITLKNNGNAPAQNLSITVTAGNNPPQQIPVPKPIAPNGTQQIIVPVQITQPGTLHIVVAVNEPNVNPAQPGKSLAKDFPIAPPAATAVPPTAVPPTGVPPTAAVAPTSAPPTTGIDFHTVPVLPDFNANNGALRTNVKAIIANNAGAQPNVFIAVGDDQLSSLSLLKADQAKFDPPDAPLAAIMTSFAPSYPLFDQIKPFAPGLTVAGLFDPAKSIGPCQTNFHQPMLQCVVEQTHARVVFLSIGRPDIENNTPIDAFQQGLTQAVQLIAAHGAVPVLMTIPGTSKPEDAAKLEAYNTAIATVAQTINVPLLNLYGALNPQPLPPGVTLLTSAGLPTQGKGTQDVGNNFTAEGQKVGVNVVNLNVIRFLSELQKVFATP